MPYAPYLEIPINPFNYVAIILNAAEQIKVNDQIKCIAVTGTSGISVGAILSFYSGKPLFVARKDCDEYHSGFKNESSLFKEVSGGFIFVDDLISTGKTFERILETVEQEHPNLSCTHVWLYHCDCACKGNLTIIEVKTAKENTSVARIIKKFKEKKKTIPC